MTTAAFAKLGSSSFTLTPRLIAISSMVWLFSAIIPTARAIAGK